MSKRNKRGLSVNSERYKQFQLACQRTGVDERSFWLGAAAAGHVSTERAINDYGRFELALPHGKASLEPYVDIAITKKLDAEFGRPRDTKLERRKKRRQTRQMLRKTHTQGRTPQPEPSYG